MDSLTLLAVAAIGTEERKFDPNQKRGEHGRWSKIGAVLKHIGDMHGSEVGLHEPFGHSDEHHTGLVAFHHDGSFSIHSHDGQTSPSHAVTVSGDEVEALHTALDVAGSFRPGRDKPGEDSGDGWHLSWDENGATLTGTDASGAQTKTELSRAEVDNLESALADARERARDYDSLVDVKPLAADETLDSKKKFGGNGDYLLGAAAVDGPDGRTVRIAPLGGADSPARALKAYSGGEGQSSAVLDKASADRLAEELGKLATDAEARRKGIAKAHDAADKPDGYDNALFDQMTAQWSTGLSTSGGSHDVDGHFGQPVEIQTPWGTLVAQGQSDEFGEWTVSLGVRPKGAVQGKDWSLDGTTGVGSAFDRVTLATKERGYALPIADLEPKDVRNLQRYLRQAFGETEGARSRMDVRTGTFNSELHPHAKAGASNGGQFVSNSGGSGSTSAAGKGSGKPASHGKKHVHIPKGSFGFDPASNHGTGYGMKHGDPRVHTLQTELNRLGFTDSHGKELDDDGKLGPLTTSAIVKAKRALGIHPADGIVDPAFIAKLGAMKTPPKMPAKKTTHPKHAMKGRRSMELCTRAFDFEFDGDSGDGRTLDGYAAVFNSPTRIRDMQGDFDETILPGAFQRSISRRMPVLQFDHGKDPRIGSTPIGKIDALSEDSRGLHVRARLFAHPDVDRVREAIAEGAITGMSFRFGVPQGGDTWTRRAGDVDLREIRDADTHELGPVVFPAYDATSVSVRSVLAAMAPDELRELAHELTEYLGLAVDLNDLAGRSAVEADGGDDSDVEPEERATRNSGPTRPSKTPIDMRTTERALKALGVL